MLLPSLLLNILVLLNLYSPPRRSRAPGPQNNKGRILFTCGPILDILRAGGRDADVDILPLLNENGDTRSTGR